MHVCGVEKHKAKRSITCIYFKRTVRTIRRPDMQSLAVWGVSTTAKQGTCRIFLTIHEVIFCIAIVRE